MTFLGGAANTGTLEILLQRSPLLLLLLLLLLLSLLLPLLLLASPTSSGCVDT